MPPKVSGREPGHARENASIERALLGVRFPISRERLVREAGHRRIPLGGDRTVTLGQILMRVPSAEFRNPQDVRDGVNRAWDDVVGLSGGAGGT